MTRNCRKMIEKTADPLLCPLHSIQFSPPVLLPLWWCQQFKIVLLFNLFKHYLIFRIRPQLYESDLKSICLSVSLYRESTDNTVSVSMCLSHYSGALPAKTNKNRGSQNQLWKYLCISHLLFLKQRACVSIVYMTHK